MANTDAPGAVLEVADIQAAARALGLEVVTPQIRRVKDIAPAFEALKGRADALLVPPEPLVFANRIRINILAASARLPTMYGSREYVEAGGLMAYGPNFPDLFRRAGALVDKILRGVKAGGNSSRAADKVRSRHQSYDRQGTGPDDARIVPTARRRGDRMKRRFIVRFC
jgi:ABC-type uncharacterized transport system substrate-binding protein